MLIHFESFMGPTFLPQLIFNTCQLNVSLTRTDFFFTQVVFSQPVYLSLTPVISLWHPTILLDTVHLPPHL